MGDAALTNQITHRLFHKGSSTALTRSLLGFLLLLPYPHNPGVGLCRGNKAKGDSVPTSSTSWRWGSRRFGATVAWHAAVTGGWKCMRRTGSNSLFEYVILGDTRDDHLGLAWVWALGRAEECLHSPYNRIHALLCRNLEAL